MSIDEVREMGPLESEMARRFVDPGWRQVSFEQRGPDGTEVLAMLLFHLCPACACVIPLGSEEEPFPDWHRDYHLGEAQALDEAASALKMLLSRVFPSLEEDPEEAAKRATATERWGFEYRPADCPQHVLDEHGIQCTRCGGVSPYSGM